MEYKKIIKICDVHQELHNLTNKLNVQLFIHDLFLSAKRNVQAWNQKGGCECWPNGEVLGPIMYFRRHNQVLDEVGLFKDWDWDWFWFG